MKNIPQLDRCGLIEAAQREGLRMARDVLGIPQLDRCGLIEAASVSKCMTIWFRIPQLDRCGLIEAGGGKGAKQQWIENIPQLDRCGLIEAAKILLNGSRDNEYSAA